VEAVRKRERARKFREQQYELKRDEISNV